MALGIVVQLFLKQNKNKFLHLCNGTSEIAVRRCVTPRLSQWQ
jgi:hypothetical protein